MGKKHLLLASAIASTIAIAHSKAQEIGQPSHGLELALQLCAQCHAVEKQQARSPNDNTPRFQVIASVPGMTVIALSAALNYLASLDAKHHACRREQADIIK